MLRVSYMWYTLAGALVTICVGAVASRVNRARGKAHVPPDPRLLAPQLRRLYREPPHPSDDTYIQAYGNNKEGCQKNSSAINMKPINESEEVS